MVRKRECEDCNEELTGKYYTFIVGKEGSKHLTPVFNRFCLPCAEKIKTKHFLYQEGLMKEIEWEAGNKTDEEIQRFEEKWKKHEFKKNQFIKRETNEKLIISWLQEAKQDLEPYLQKLQIANQTVIYQWIDAREENCRRIRLGISDQKWALQSFLRALEIKEKELKGETKPAENDKSPNSNRPQEQNASNSTIQPKPTNWTLIIILSITGIAVITGLIFYLLRKKTISN